MTVQKLSTDLTSTPINASEFNWAGHMADDVANTYGPEPMATLTATATELVLSGSRGTFRVPRSGVIRLGRGKLYPWFFSAIRIHHTITNIPRDLQFKPLGLKPGNVLKELSILGYPLA